MKTDIFEVGEGRGGGGQGVGGGGERGFSDLHHLLGVARSLLALLYLLHQPLHVAETQETAHERLRIESLLRKKTFIYNKITK